MVRTTITISEGTKRNIENLKIKSGYKSYDELLSDMQNFYATNGLNPKHYNNDMVGSVNAAIKKSIKETDTKLRKYIGYESKEIKGLLGQDIDTHSLKNIYESLTALASWLIIKLEDEPSRPAAPHKPESG